MHQESLFVQRWPAEVEVHQESLLVQPSPPCSAATVWGGVSSAQHSRGDSAPGIPVCAAISSSIVALTSPPLGNWARGAMAARPSTRLRLRKFEMAIKDLATHTFSENISWIFVTQDFPQSEVSAPKAFLDPKLSHGQVANASYAASATYADGCG